MKSFIQESSMNVNAVKIALSFCRFMEIDKIWLGRFFRILQAFDDMILQKSIDTVKNYIRIVFFFFNERKTD